MLRTSLLLICAVSAAALAIPPSPDSRRELEIRHVVHGGRGTGSTYGERNSDAFGGMLIGIILLVVAPLLLVATEFQAVKLSRLLDRAKLSTLPNVPSASIDPNLENRMVHSLGPISVGNEPHTDKETGVSFGPSAYASAQVDASSFDFPLAAGSVGMVASTPLRVQRKVEVFQWTERKEKDNNETRWV